jgi:hypothetical protein
VVVGEREEEISPAAGQVEIAFVRLVEQEFLINRVFLAIPQFVQNAGQRWSENKFNLKEGMHGMFRK